jgi:hypothetical protein
MPARYARCEHGKVGACEDCAFTHRFETMLRSQPWHEQPDWRALADELAAALESIATGACDWPNCKATSCRDGRAAAAALRRYETAKK